MLAEGRHPTRAELDRVAPGHPVRLIHRSGHAEVLSSLGLARIGVDESTPEPAGAAFGRSLEDGRLDGLLIGMAERVEAVMAPPDLAAVAQAVRAWGRGRAAEGVATLGDAGARNGLAEWEELRALVECGALPQRVVVMEGAEQLGTLPEQAAAGRMRRGEVKLQPRVLEGEGFAAGPLAALVRRAAAAGRRVAVHAPTAEAVRSALAAFPRGRGAAGSAPGARAVAAGRADRGDRGGGRRGRRAARAAHGGDASLRAAAPAGRARAAAALARAQRRRRRAGVLLGRAGQPLRAAGGERRGFVAASGHARAGAVAAPARGARGVDLGRRRRLRARGRRAAACGPRSRTSCWSRAPSRRTPRRAGCWPRWWAARWPTRQQRIDGPAVTHLRSPMRLLRPARYGPEAQPRDRSRREMRRAGDGA